MSGALVAARPHPLKEQRIVGAAPEGASIAVLVALHVPEPWRRQARVTICGHLILPAAWPRVRPRAGVTVEITVVPANRGVLTAVLMIGVVAAAAFAGPFAVGPLGLGLASGSLGAAVGGALVTAGVGTLGMLAVNALVPPPQPGLSSGRRDAPTYSIEGSRNTPRPLSVVPQVLGRHRMVPPLAAQTVTELSGADVYLRMLVTWGLGPVTIDEIKIGETPLDQFADVEIETELGTPGQAPTLDLYSRDIFQENLNEQLTEAGGWASRTTQPETDEISIDITLPRGLIIYASNSGNRLTHSVTLEIEHRAVGAPSWTALDDLVIEARTSSVLRRNVRWQVARGQHEVRLRRASDDDTLDRKISDTVWTTLRSVSHESPIAEPGLAATALRIRANEQLSGVIDTLNAIVTSVCPDWDAGTQQWVTRATRNPAALFRLVLQGAAAPVAVTDAEIDLAQLQAWHEHCQAQGFTCDLVVDWEASTDEALGIVAACGRARPIQVDGRWSVAIDEPTAVVVQDFSPRRTIGFSQQRIFVREAHALRIQFFNAAQGWRLDERIVYADGHDLETATRLEDAELPGVTDAELVHRFGRWMLARARFQQERTEITTDWQHLIAQPGDRIRVAHDAVLWGTGWGRLAAVEIDGAGDGTALQLDERVTLANGKSYVARVQRSDGESLLLNIVTAVGESDRFSLATPLAAAELPAAGDHVIIGEAGRETQDLLVIGKQPGADLSATLVCVPYVDLSDVDTDPIPAFDSRVSLPVGSEVPIIERVRSDETVLQRDADGAVHLAALVTIWSATGRPMTRLAGLELRWRDVESGGPYQALLARADAVEVRLEGVEQGQEIEIAARWLFRGSGDEPVAGSWSPITTHTVVGPNLPPPDVDTVYQDGELMRWQAVTGPDHAGWLLRVAAVAGASWEAATALHAGIFSGDSLSLDLIPRSAVELHVKAVTVSAIESTGAARGAVDRALAPGRLSVDSFAYHTAGWPGAVIGATRQGSRLEATSSTAMWPDPAAAAWPDPAAAAFDVAWNRVSFEGDWSVPEGALSTDTIEIDWLLQGAGSVVVKWVGDIVITFADDDDLSDVADDGDDLPANALAFGTALGEATVRPAVPYRGPIRPVAGETLRVMVTIPGGTDAQPILEELTVTLRAQVVTEMLGDTAVAAGGSNLPTTRSLRQIIGVNGLLDGASSAQVLRVLDKSDPVAGALVAAYDAAGQSVAATADIAITGV